MSDVIASAHDLQALCGLLHPLCGLSLAKAGNKVRQRRQGIKTGVEDWEHYRERRWGRKTGKRRWGTKTVNKDREPRLRTKTKNGETRIRKEKDGEKVYPVSETVCPLKKERKVKSEGKKGYPTYEKWLPGLRKSLPSFRNFRKTGFNNGFAIFSWAVVVGSKGGLMVPGARCQVPGAMCDVIFTVWAVAVSMWAVTSSMWEVTASMHDVKVVRVLLHPL